MGSHLDLLSKIDELEVQETVSEAVSTSVQNGDKNALANILHQQKSKIEAERVESDKLANELTGFTLILNNEDAEKATTKLKTARKQVKNVSELRLEITRPIDAFTKGLKGVEDACNERLVTEIDRVKSSLNAYWAEIEKQAEIERKRIEVERLKKLEIERVKVAIDSQIEAMILNAATSYREAIHKAFELMTLANFEQKSKALKSVKPQLSVSSYDSLFAVEYNNRITDSEYEKIVSFLQSKYPYEYVNKKYKEWVMPTIKSAINSLPQKIAELKKLAELEKENKQEAEKIRAKQQAERQRQEKERQRQQETEQKARKEREEKAKADAIIQAELEAQAKAQAVNTPGRKVKYVAELSDNTDYATLFNTAIDAGYKTKELLKVLQSMANFLANGEKPEIKGITYKTA